ncbi:MAG TPA: PA14 domain-containing protein [Puia sp.]|nr:PA14 domain-containing protein [Puia sp.]
MKSPPFRSATDALIIIGIIQLAIYCGSDKSREKSHADAQQSQNDPAKNDSLAFGNLNWESEGLVGKVYLLNENTPMLPDFDTMQAVNTLYTKSIDIPTRNWETGFPGLPNRHEWFAIEYKGNFKVKNAGHYTFRLVSDDGSKLFIDGKKIIDNDGLHSTLEKTGEIYLDNSDHSVIVDYFQGPPVEIALQLFASFEKQKEEVFPGTYFILSTPGRSFHSVTLLLVVVFIVLVLLIVVYRQVYRKN